MSRKVWTVASISACLAMLAGASYVAISLIFTGSVGLGALHLPGLGGSAEDGKQRGYEVIPAAELPQTQADLFGSLVEKRDNSLMLRPITKGPSDPNNPLVEVVVTANTKVYLDTTSEQTSPIVDGKIQQTLAPFDANSMMASDTVVAWGPRRGDRLTAEVVVDERNH